MLTDFAGKVRDAKGSPDVVVWLDAVGLAEQAPANYTSLAVHQEGREVFVEPSERWSDPRAKLLSGAAWEAARPGVLRALVDETRGAYA